MAKDLSPENHEAEKPKRPEMKFEDGPLALKPILVERIWGTKDLGDYYDGPAPEKRVGEIWLTAQECMAIAGGGRGQTLGELTAGSPEVLGAASGEGFPLLIKLLFPNEKLSVQVHPNDTEAQAQGMPRGKSECWYILEAEPGAEVAVGFNEPLTPEQIRAAIEDGSIESKLRKIPVQIGQMVYVDAGTVHAIGPGMVVLEIQQYSDTTYRLWDYGRPRELHLEEGLKVSRTDTEAGLVSPVEHRDYTRLISTPYFIVDRINMTGSANVHLDDTDQMQILVATGDFCSVIVNGDHPFDLPRGQAVILPATGIRYDLHSRGLQHIFRIMKPKAQDPPNT